MVICKSTGLSKTYQDNYNITHAIVNCNIEISAGEFVAIGGTKYSGKTTLLRILGGFERPTYGNVYFNQKNISSYNDDELAALRREKIGYLFDHDSLIPELNVHENIIIPAILNNKRYNETHYKSLVERLQLKELLSSYPKQLSISQLQRVICARAMMNDPDLILVDEPDCNVTKPLDKEILDFLLNMVYHHHKTLIMVTNDSEISIFVDHIITLKDGEVIEDRRIS